MNTWLSVLDQWGYEVLRYLLSVLWQSSLLFLAIASISRLLRGRKPAVRRLLWILALAMGPFLPLLSTTSAGWGTPQAELPLLPAYQAPVAAPPTPAVFSEISDAETLPLQAPIAVTPEGVPAPPPLTAYPWALGLIAYLTGLLPLLALYVVGHLRVSKWRRTSQPLETQHPVCVKLQHESEQLCAKWNLPFRVRLSTSSSVAAPVSLGVLRPAILLPPGLLEELTDAERHAVLVHELAHLKRWDPLVLSVLGLVRVVLYFHPLVWLAVRQVRALAEQAADDAVLEAGRDPVEYAKLLTRLAEGLPRRMPATEFATGIVLSQGVFLYRIESILSERREQLQRLGTRALVGIGGAAMLGLGLSLTLPLTQQQSNLSREFLVNENAGGGTEEESAGHYGGGSSRPAPESDRSASAPDPQEPRIHEVTLGVYTKGHIHDLSLETLIRQEYAHTGFGYTYLAGANPKSGGLIVHGMQLALGLTRPYADSSEKLNAAGKAFYDSSTAGEGIPEQDLWSMNSAAELPPFDRSDEVTSVLAPLGAPVGDLQPYPLPRAYAFKTVDGDVGVFQIVSAEDGYVRLRYKWLQRINKGPVLRRKILTEMRSKWLQSQDAVEASKWLQSQNAVQTSSVSDKSEISRPTGGRGVVKGLVVDAETGAPIAGAFVAVDHSGDAGGSNLERFREEGIYVTAETNALGWFSLENVALLDYPHPFYVTAPGYERYEQEVVLKIEASELELEVRLERGGRIEVPLEPATLEQTHTLIRLQSLEGYELVPPGQDWPRGTSITKVLEKDEIIGFGGLRAGRYRVDALAATRGGEWLYLGKHEELVLSKGELLQAPLTLNLNGSAYAPGTSADTLLEVRLQAPREEALRKMVAIARLEEAPEVPQGTWMHAEDERVGKIAFASLLFTEVSTEAADEEKPEGMSMFDWTMKNLPPAEYVVYGIWVRPPAMALQSQTVKVEPGNVAQVSFNWQEPEPPRE